MSCAVKTVVSATVSLTVNVATPEPFVTPETVVIAAEPPPFVNVTALPGTGFRLVSRRVTVTVDAVLPSAVTEAGAALTLESVAVGVPAVKVTVAVWVTVTESVESVAV